MVDAPASSTSSAGRARRRKRPAAEPRATPAPRRAARKVATNVSLPGELVARARMLKLNFSRVFHEALIAAVIEAERASWLAENEEAIADYNARVAERGVFSDDWRKF